MGKTKCKRPAAPGRRSIHSSQAKEDYRDRCIDRPGEFCGRIDLHDHVDLRSFMTHGNRVDCYRIDVANAEMAFTGSTQDLKIDPEESLQCQPQPLKRFPNLAKAR